MSMYRVPGPIPSGGRVLAYVNVTATPKGGRSRSRPLPASAAQQHRRGVTEHCQGSRQCPPCSFLPDLRGQSSSIQNSLKKILLCQIPALGLLKGDHSRFTTTRKAKHRPPSTQLTKAKDVLTHSSLGEGSGPRRRCCPFRVRFADESMWDTLLRYWERTCAVQQNTIKNRTVTLPTVTEQVFRSIGRWLDSLPKDLYPSNKQDTMAGPSDWDCPSLPTQESQSHLSEDASMSSSLPFIPRATIQRQWRPLKTFLGTHNVLERVGKLHSSWSRKLESFLPSLTPQRAQK
ncbi:PREDICTED: uncharacterized protein C9orf50 homolog isoform X2 [Galeopterus variegatus]|uniref:Uncharacterized protein C9orf50 homolog isoform X2 n=1 Tax=Galeopterus variegatus TaxID=482537 RepID=A0ABM0RLA3_GALVR|nr:PREDICTED: uncharacterized protein C9orf50 homolog isoform X2 [Galeopterus variegatus]